MTSSPESDFYSLELLLDPAGRDLLQRVREFMEKQIEPVINRYWTREEFPRELVPAMGALGIAGLAYTGYGCPGGNGILLEHHVGRFVADAEAIYSYEGTREVNTLIVGRAMTGTSAFV
jgi:alkylation response protein AidB-like acyl-CoA dehydrogenase